MSGTVQLLVKTVCGFYHWSVNVSGFQDVTEGQMSAEGLAVTVKRAFSSHHLVHLITGYLQDKLAWVSVDWP